MVFEDNVRLLINVNNNDAEMIVTINNFELMEVHTHFKIRDEKTQDTGLPHDTTSHDFED